MDSFIVSARKYRPSLFKEVRAQSQVITTLLNQLKNKKVPQVVLFCGPRGSGKTSCGRIFAKAINCEALEASGEPCNKCVSCTQFQQQTSMNIHELDAASHNSVEDVRQLLEQVRYHPASGRKVFIIDEVHMLSNAAFNALLKTLEEPPAHVVFILATTERHKIIPTILSRCQIFDFRPIPEVDIVQQLQYIAKKEGITADEEALHLISEQSEGSFREALHAFDKIVAFGGGKQLSKEGVLRNLQILDYTYYFDIIDALYQGNIGEALQIYNTILRSGFENQPFIKGISKHLRNVLVAQTTTSKELLQAASTVIQAYQAQAKRIDTRFLHKALMLLEQCELHYKERQDKRLHVEITLIKLSQLQAPLSPQSNTTPPSKKERVTPTIPHKEPKAAPQVTKPLPTTSEKSNPSASKQPQKPLDIAQVSLHWKAYSEKLKKQGAMSALATMMCPITIEGDTIVLEIGNTLQKNTLHNHYDDLLAYLREQLDAPSLKVITRLVQKESNAKKPYTNHEKLKHLMNSYPAVEELQKALDLS